MSGGRFNRVAAAGWLGIALVWAVGAHPASVRAGQADMTLEELGREVCRGQPGLCGRTWAAEGLRGGSFNLLIFHTCSLVENRWGDHAGIACVERAIAASAHLSTEALVHGQFKPGEREAHPVWKGSPDTVWAERIREMIRRVPPYCDQNTPVIYNYFACVVSEVRNLTLRLKRIT